MPTTLKPAAADGEGQRVRPGAHTTAQAYRLRATPYFLLVHNPLSWEIAEVELEDEAGEITGSPVICWLPRLKRLELSPGVNGVRMGRRGSPPDASLAVANLRTQGWTMIPEDYDGGYVNVHPGARGPIHVLKFDQPVNVGSKTVLRCDDEGYKRFRYRLVVDGVIKPPEPEALEAIMDLRRNRIARHQREVHIPAVRARVDALEEELGEMKEAAEEIAPKPKRKRRATKAKTKTKGKS